MRPRLRVLRARHQLRRVRPPRLQQVSQTIIIIFSTFTISVWYGICQTPNRYFPPPHLLLCLDAFTGARCCRATHWPMTMPEIKPGLVTTGTNTPGVHQSGAGAAWPRRNIFPLICCRLDQMVPGLRSPHFRSYPVCGNCYEDWHL